MEVSIVLLDYLAGVKQLGVKTQIGYRQRLTVFAEWCALQGIELEQVNNRTVQEFLAWLSESHKPHKTGQEKISTHTLAGYVRCIWALLHWCLDDEEYSEYVKLPTVKGIKMPRTEKQVKDTFTDEEIEALFTAASRNPLHHYKLRDTAILALLVDCGLRADELCTLRLGNVTFARLPQDDSYIKVMGKGRKEREIPLGNKSRRALARYMREYRKDAKKSDPVFLSRYHTPLTVHALALILDRLKETSMLAEDAQVNPHKFRHTWATRFMANGGDVYDLSRLMGHSTVAITEGYLKSLSAKAVRTRKDHRSVLDEM